MGKRVYQAANEPKRIELFPKGDHLDLFDYGAWEKVRRFLDSQAKSALPDTGNYRRPIAK